MIRAGVGEVHPLEHGARALEPRRGVDALVIHAALR